MDEGKGSTAGSLHIIFPQFNCGTHLVSLHLDYHVAGHNFSLSNLISRVIGLSGMRKIQRVVIFIYLTII